MAETLLGKKLNVPEGVVILSEGENQTSAYRIISGRVEVYKIVGGKRVVLARLGPGQFFGEMNLVLESARSASVMAIEPCVLRVITQDVFNRLLRREPKAVLPLLRVLFERLRVMNLKYLEALEAKGNGHAEAPAKEAKTGTGPTAERNTVASLAGETPVMTMLLGKDGLAVKQFPFRIGRKSGHIGDAFTLNDLYVPDTSPFQVSRNHCSIEIAPDGRLHVQDRGSKLGTVVNGSKIGANTGRLDAPLRRGTNTVILGNPASPYRFTIALE